MRFSVIITAGGIGRRMRSSLPKQFMLVNEKPLLMYTIERFYHYDPKMQLVLSLPEEWMHYWEDQIAQHDFVIPHRVVTGGKERYDSIKNALNHCTGDIVAVHDGVRPLVSSETLQLCLKGAISYEAVIPVMPINESVRKREGDSTVSVNRSDYMIVQTPQCFKKEVIIKAYEQVYHEGITDDATLVEEAGYTLHIVDGNPENIKITTQSDLKLAEAFLK